MKKIPRLSVKRSNGSDSSTEMKQEQGNTHKMLLCVSVQTLGKKLHWPQQFSVLLPLP